MPRRPVVKFEGKLPKLGNAESECEDSFSSHTPRFAVADGASEGVFSGIWSEMLVKRFTRVSVSASDWDGAQAFVALVEECRTEWTEWERELARRDLPWFTREKLQQGSFATFLGVVIEADSWRAFAWGDSCLFAVRRGALIESFPVQRSADFDNTPALVPTAGVVDQSQLLTREGRVEAGDRFYLVSDALASWFLADYERGEEPWVALDGISDSQELEILVSEARRDGRMKNDDVTLIAIEIEG